MNASGRILTALSKFLDRNKNVLRFTGMSALISNDSENLVIKHDDVTDEFPLVWLRDNCTCSHCFHRASQSRIIDWCTFDMDVEVKTVETNNDLVQVNWNDNHKSVYSFDWLKRRSFKEESQDNYLKNVYIPPREIWSKGDFFNVMKLYEYKEVMTNDAKFYQWLMDLCIHGVVLLKNAPKDALECRKLSDKIAFIRKTHYGEDFHVVAREDTNNVAYLSNPLQMHTDLPYYDYKPGANLLHCIVQTENKGGENLLTDGFYVAEKLRHENKEVFDLLTQTEVNWSDVGEEEGVKFYKIHRAPVISLDAHNNIHSVRHSIPQRDSHFTVNLNNVRPWYQALKTFVTELYRNAAVFKTEPGDILAFDNTRLVHGRVGYKDTEKVRRFLVGHFVDWDEIYSKMRILRKELGK